MLRSYLHDSLCIGLLLLVSTRTGAGETGPDAPSPSAAASPSPAMVALRTHVRQALDSHYVRPLNSRDDSPWSVLHWSIAYGVDAQLRVGGPGGEKANAIGWLCFHRASAGLAFVHLYDGQLYLPIAPGLQGHSGQFLSMLAQARVRADFPLHTEGRSFTVADLVQQEQRTCESGTELTFKLIGLSHYLPSDASWTNVEGERWDIPRLIRDELRQPVLRGACCGGTHRLMGLSYAVRKRESRREPVEGAWLRAKEYVEEYQRYALSLQNADGSFSTAFFLYPDNRGDVARRIETTGHVLEWLVFSLPVDQLQDPRIVRAVDYLSGLLIQYPDGHENYGSLGHALHALSLYEERVFHARPGDRSTRLAAARSETPAR
ncbi:MAG: hypothetical protein AB7F89_18320 [Pirellulaceae bacterium]